MSENPHAPWSLCAGHSRALVFVHGICGSPVQFQTLGRLAHAAGWDCYALLLPGHGGSAADFAAARRSAWQRHVDETLAELTPRYRLIAAFGHSLGGLLALRAAEKRPLVCLVLLCPALAPKLSPVQAWRSARVLWGNPARDNVRHQAYRAAYSVGKARWFEFPRWIWPMLELLRAARETSRVLTKVHCPALVLQAAHDESLWIGGVQRLAATLPKARLVWLPGSTHLYFPPEDAEVIGREMLAFLDKLST